MEEKEIKVSTYPEGWEYVKGLIDFTDDDGAKEGFMMGMMITLLGF